MASKKPSDTASRSNKIRFVLVEADISDGNLSELTQAITSALKPAAPLRTVVRAAPVLPPAHEDVEEAVTEEIEPEDLTAADSNGDETEPKTPRAKKFKAPEYLPELLAGEKGKAFKEFAAEKAPSTKSKKYLVASYWLKEHGGSPNVDANKVYTCFKTANWSTGFNDWRQTFDNLVHSEHLRKVGSGEFTINPLGEDVVTKGTD